MSDVILIFLVFLFIGIGIFETIRNYKWNLKPLNNFPFMYRGKEYWYSRSVATSPFVFCKNEDGEYCVLANKRGVGTPDFQGYWNVPTGYIIFGIDGEDNCIKETFEETGVVIPKEKLKLIGVSTDPNDNKQNIGLRYYAILDEPINQYVLSDSNSEKNEVSDIKWIPLSKINEYEWAFNHDLIIKKIQETILDN